METVTIPKREYKRLLNAEKAYKKNRRANI